MILIAFSQTLRDFISPPDPSSPQVPHKKLQREEGITSTVENTSVDLFASDAHWIDNDMDDDIKHIVTIAHSASCRAERTGCSRMGTACSAICASDQNNIPLPVPSRPSDRMFIKMVEKVNDKIDRNVVDFRQLYSEDRGRIGELERRVQVIEDKQEMKTGPTPPAAAAQQKLEVSLPDPAQETAPSNQFSVSAPKGRRQAKPCNICAKVLSVPYVYKHQKQVHRTPKK